MTAVRGLQRKAWCRYLFHLRPRFRSLPLIYRSDQLPELDCFGVAVGWVTLKDCVEPHQPQKKKKKIGGENSGVGREDGQVPSSWYLSRPESDRRKFGKCAVHSYVTLNSPGHLSLRGLLRWNYTSRIKPISFPLPTSSSANTLPTLTQLR